MLIISNTFREDLYDTKVIIHVYIVDDHLHSNIYLCLHHNQTYF
jgi:hypothetical protein